MHTFLADCMRNPGFLQRLEDSKNTDILTLQDHHSSSEHTALNHYPDDPFLLMLALDREDERKRQQRILIEKKLQEQQAANPSDQNNSHTSSFLRQLRESADCAEEIWRFRRAFIGY